MRIPPYASSLHFELYKKDKDDYYVQLYYRTDNEEDPEPIKIPGCGRKCTIDELHKIYRDIIPDDFDSECSLSDE